MTDQIKDIVVFVDGNDETFDNVRAGVAMRIAEHHGARITVFEMQEEVILDRLTLIGGVEEAPYAGVEPRGLQHAPTQERRIHSSPLEKLLHETRLYGTWSRRPDDADVLERMRCSDLVVVGSPVSLDGNRSMSLENIVEKAGRPSLVIPRKFAQRRTTERGFGNRVLIAWNGSAQAARAVHDALPFLRRAAEVVVLLVNDHGPQDAATHSVHALAGHLQRHSVNVSTEVLPTGDLEPAEALLARMTELGNDLLVMGAFGRSRLRETLFGGMSKSLLHAVAVPIFTSH